MSELSIPDRLRLWAEQNPKAAATLLDVIDTGGGEQIYVPLVMDRTKSALAQELRERLLKG